MDAIDGTPFQWLIFDAKGGLTDPNALSGLQALLTESVTDLVVISHGWKTDKSGAWALYEHLWANVRAAWPGAAARRLSGFVVAGVQWPSLQFRTDFDNPSPDQGGVLGLPEPNGEDGDLSRGAFNTFLDDFVDVMGLGGEGVRTAALAAQDDIGPERSKDLFDAIMAVVSTRHAESDRELSQNLAPWIDKDPQGLLLDLMAPPGQTLDPGVGSAQGLATDLNITLQGPRAAIARLLNQFTYYEMKARAGVVGAALGSKVVTRLNPPSPVRLHLIGHSFGARLVTSAAATIPSVPNLSLHSLTLLQAAFSHNAFSSGFGGGRVGAFPGVIGKVQGPISATHTHNDSACTIAYALASRLVRDVTQFIGSASDPFGAIGANGILNLTAAQAAPGQTMGANQTYAFVSKRANNVAADRCIKEHMDVTNADVGGLVAHILQA